MAIFGERVYKMRPLGWVLVQNNWYPMRGGNLDTDREKEGQVKIQRKGGHLRKAKERDLKRN